MIRHAGYEDLIALRMGTLSGDDSRELLNHVASCALCQRAGQEMLDVRADARETLHTLASEDTPRRTLPVRWLAAAAVLALVALTAPLLLRDRTPRPAPPPVVTATTPPPAPEPAVPSRRAPWDAVVRDAAASGEIAPPALLLSLQPPRDEFRSRTTDEGDRPDMQPSGEIIESDRPLLRWPGTEGATYTVIIGERGRIVAQSASLDGNSWQLTVPLPRGRTYVWQVEVRKGDRSSMIPMPPAPSARFHVLAAAAKAQLDEARHAAPGDHLLLGIVHARAGLRAQAIAHFDAVSGEDSGRARVLRASIEKWPSARR